MMHWSVIAAIVISLFWGVFCVWVFWGWGQNSYGNRPQSYWQQRVEAGLVLWSVPMILFLAIWGGVFWW